MDFQENIITRFEHLKEICRFIWEPSDLEKIERAFYFARDVVGVTQFKTGENILVHSLEVATIIAQEIGLGPDSIITGLLHNVMYAGLTERASKEEIEKQFGPRIYTILEGMAKITISAKDYVLRQGEVIILPANEPHALQAVEPFKMLLIMIKSE